ncbi:MAG: hypothetical protein H0T53_06155 [Herpetosiphonaceae bacterium]|nr:hypothetical protein [Herpetosiphonaceae bacterium]
MTATAETCSRCGKPIAADEVHMGQPLITAGELARIAVKSPAALAGPTLPDVPYCAECRPIVAQQRTMEQLKVLGFILFLLILVALGIFVLL